MGTFQRKGTTPKHQLSGAASKPKLVNQLGRTKAFVPDMNQHVAGLTTTPSYLAMPSVIANQDATGRAGGSFFPFLNRQFGIDSLMNMFGKIQKIYGMFQQARSMYSTFQSFMGPQAVTTGIRSKRTHFDVASSPKKSRSSIRLSCDTAARRQRLVRK